MPHESDQGAGVDAGFAGDWPVRLGPRVHCCRCEDLFLGWKNSNIDDIEFRDLRTIAAAENPSPWIYQPVWNAEFSAEDAAWHEEYMSAAFRIARRHIAV